MLQLKDKLNIKVSYQMCEDEDERVEMIGDLAMLYETSQMEIRQILQSYGVYEKKEGKTEKAQYARALWSVTGVPEKEWLKISLKAKKQLMEWIKDGSK